MVLEWLKERYTALVGKEEVGVGGNPPSEWTFDEWREEIVGDDDLDELWEYMDIIEDSKVLTDEEKKKLIGVINEIFDKFIKGE